MRHVLVVLLVTVPAATLSAQGSPATASRISACAVMPRELVEAMSPNPQLVKRMGPQEEVLGAKGSSCEYGLLGLQVDPFANTTAMRRSPGSDWQPVAGVGDAAFFRNKANLFAELIVWTGAHHFTLQLGTPNGRTPEAIKPDLITMATAVIARLR